MASLSPTLQIDVSPSGPISSPARHRCFCGKSYVRKEHLRRHQAVHDKPKHVCEQCGSAFGRKDMLRRHVKEHSFTKRSRACDTCHANKTKCDGGEPCSLCLRRRVACEYSSNGPQTTEPAPEAGRITVASSVSVDEHVSEEPNGPGPQRSRLHQPSGDAPSESHVARSSVSDELNSGLRTILDSMDAGLFQKQGLFQRQEQPGRPEQCLKNYIQHFHHHWHIIHAPTYEFQDHAFGNAAMIYLIGAYCWDQADDELEIDPSVIPQAYARILDLLFNWLYHSPSLDPEETAWPFQKYQAVLLAMIFAIYLSDEEAIHRAKKMLDLLVTCLRTADFFCNKTAKRQQELHFPGDYMPWKFNIEQQRNSIAAHLFKIDAHLAVLTQQPPQLRSFELDVSLPATFSHLNAYGLDVFWERYPTLKRARPDTTMSVFLHDPKPTFESGMLIEDVHVGLCGLAPDAWQLTQLARVGTRPETANKLYSSLASGLSFWRSQLQACVLHLSGGSSGLLRSTYLGETEHPEHIMQSLLNETLAWYHLLSLVVAVHNPEEPGAKTIMLGMDLSKSDFLPPSAMKTVYHSIAIGALSLSRPTPPILEHARVFAREGLETMLEDSCWCTFSNSRFDLSLGDVRLEEEESICGIPLGKFWVFVDGHPLCTCDKSTFLERIGLADAEG